MTDNDQNPTQPFPVADAPGAGTDPSAPAQAAPAQPVPVETGQETIGATGAASGDSALEKDPSEWVSGDDPMTESQKSYLDTLAREAGEVLPADLTKAEASEHIDRLKGASGS